MPACYITVSRWRESICGHLEKKRLKLASFSRGRLLTKKMQGKLVLAVHCFIIRDGKVHLFEQIHRTLKVRVAFITPSVVSLLAMVSCYNSVQTNTQHCFYLVLSSMLPVMVVIPAILREQLLMAQLTKTSRLVWLLRFFGCLNVFITKNNEKSCENKILMYIIWNVYYLYGLLYSTWNGVLQTHFKLHSLLHKLCHRALGCRSRWLWWCTVDTDAVTAAAAAAAAATVAVDKPAPSLAAGSLACLFSSNCTDGCTFLICLCRLFVEPAPYQNLESESESACLAKNVNACKEFDSVFFFTHSVHRHNHKHNITNIQLERARTKKKTKKKQ